MDLLNTANFKCNVQKIENAWNFATFSDRQKLEKIFRGGKLFCPRRYIMNKQD